MPNKDTASISLLAEGDAASFNPTNQVPSVSVVIPCYRQACFLPEAVRSVIAQTFADFELIIVNDGSQDETSQVAREIIARHPERRIRLLEKANGGLADARNAGIKEARGKYILPLDADDRVHPEMLQKTVALLEANPHVAIAYTDVVHFGAVSKLVRADDYDFSRLPRRNHLNCCSLFRRDAWSAAGGYNTNMKLGYEDWDFWIGCGEKGYFARRIPEPLLFYRVKDCSMYTKAVEHDAELRAQIVLNHPRLFKTEELAAARQVLAATASAGPPAETAHGTARSAHERIPEFDPVNELARRPSQAPRASRRSCSPYRRRRCAGSCDCRYR